MRTTDRPHAPARRAAPPTLALLLAALMLGPARAAPPSPPPLPPTDPKADFLSPVDGAPALAWVRAQNRRTEALLEGDPRFAGFRAAALKAAQSPRRLATPELIGGAVYNFWQDADHRRGIWRRSDPASFAAGAPHWETVLDLDALARDEGRDWVWKGADCDMRVPAGARPSCLVALSVAGEDAVSVREIDAVDGHEVDGGFALPRGKQDYGWIDHDHIAVARDWGEVGGRSSLTPSGYPFIVRVLARGGSLDRATPLFAGEPTDVGVEITDRTDADGRRAVLIRRETTFFSSEFRLLAKNGTIPLRLPPQAEPAGFVRGRLVFEVHAPVPAAGGRPAIPAGSLVSIPAADPGAAPEPVFVPGPTQSLEDEVSTADALVVAVDDDVRGTLWCFAPAGGGPGWTARRVPMPADLSIRTIAGDSEQAEAYVESTGFLSPSALWRVAPADAAATTVASMPAEFDASGLVVEQRRARSPDGTMIPYFLVHRAGMALDGSHPTLLTAYGGFQVSSLPAYDPIIGRLWLARGGVYALANIRGGGEFGPAWHEAGRKTNRQRVFDDFAAVGRDLIARRVTATPHLGIRGRSNGGLLMGVEFTQHPELWGAVIIGVPLLDMEQYETMAAGASWVDEYGSMSVPAERAFLERISPLQALRPGVRYPEPFIFTSTKDDRVGPVHARRFAFRLAELGVPFLYYEDTEGGHSGTANAPEIARERALEAVYLSRKLMDPPPAPPAPGPVTDAGPGSATPPARRS